MLLFIDTNIFIEKKFGWSSGYLRTIKGLATSGWLKILTNSITKQEVLDHIAFDLKESVELYNSLLKKSEISAYTKELELPISKLELSSQINLMSQKCEAYFSGEGIEEVPVTSCSVLTLVSDYINKKPPFERKKPTEFKDAIVGYSLNEFQILKGQQIIIISNDKGFCKIFENNDNFIVLDRIEYVFSLLKKNFVSSIEEQIQLALDGDRLEERIEEYLIDLPVELDTDYWYYDSCDVTEIYNIDIVGIELIDFDLDIWVGDVLDTKKLELQEGTGTVSASINVAFTMNVDYSVIDEDNSKYDRESHDYIIKNYINFTDEYKLERVIQINFEYYVEDENITFDDIYIDVNNETKLYLDQSEMTNQSFTTSFDERYLMPDEL
ncbi:MAG: PIN domain-containing protein [Veillonella sp.]|jgi:hypothetical protein|uniref:PIN domain-containing protein n=1 Tax=Veillonella sp. TaxID=1926307 RepID=UPI00290BF4B5|nr:PIN domain-containing protein [Veillonella sp.]MDU4763971.1 PIN domain-containing protein [Veillonella sp.]